MRSRSVTFVLAAALAGLSAPAAAAAAPAMSAATFVAKAEALMAKGPMALFSSDYKLLKSLGERTGAELRAEREGQLRANRAPSYCPPKGKVDISSREMVAGLKAIPAARMKGLSLKDGMRDVLIARYPCRRG